ncbi:hypothetical protein BGZ82_001183 [Podila clonocystis]|nr:hypothetical protein BGZ82_001183 [Podila clonocystis]
MLNDTTAEFDLSKMLVAESNFQIDKNIQLKSPPDSACLVKTLNDKEVEAKLTFKSGSGGIGMGFSLDFYAKPCAAYLKYVEDKSPRPFRAKTHILSR